MYRDPMIDVLIAGDPRNRHSVSLTPTTAAARNYVRIHIAACTLRLFLTSRRRLVIDVLFMYPVGQLQQTAVPYARYSTSSVTPVFGLYDAATTAGGFNNVYTHCCRNKTVAGRNDQTAVWRCILLALRGDTSPRAAARRGYSRPKTFYTKQKAKHKKTFQNRLPIIYNTLGTFCLQFIPLGTCSSLSLPIATYVLMNAYTR